MIWIIFILIALWYLRLLQKPFAEFFIVVDPASADGDRWSVAVVKGTPSGELRIISITTYAEAKTADDMKVSFGRR